MQREIEKHGHVLDAEKKFITLSHTTSDSITRLALKNGLGVVKTWVGFAALAAATRDIWDGKHAKYDRLVEGRDPDNPALCDPFVCACYAMDNGERSFNVAAMEQSNGFSLLGGPPPDKRSLGVGGHVRDKDGTFAAFLIAEIAAWAKEQGTTLFELMDEHIYLDPAIGLFVSGYEPDPMDGEYPGIEGDRLKKAILRRALSCLQLALTGDLDFAGMKVKSACVYRTGKYDAIYPPSDDFMFPDEGIRFFFDDERLCHVTVRPSGTGNSLRFHTQLYRPAPKADLIHAKQELRFQTEQILQDVRRKLDAPKGKLFV
jgi:phosphomannomutase